MQAATNCKKKFSCLAGTKSDVCQVLSCYDDDIHFILCADNQYCSYQKKVSERVYCDCPVRKEIYDKYKI